MGREYVWLIEERNRGWPWPDDSWGLSPMFSPGGWCPGCGMPLRDQVGSLVLRRKGFQRASGAWLPYWRYDAICVEQPLADRLARQFDLEFRPVVWRGDSPGEASQIVVPSVGESWFDPIELAAAAEAEHGESGASCVECHRWRWMPVPAQKLPPLRIVPGLADADIAGSPEWFGSGWSSFREFLVVRDLADAIATASPRDFTIRRPHFA